MSLQRNSVRLRNYHCINNISSTITALTKLPTIIVEVFMIQVQFGAKMIFDEDRIHTVTPEFREPGGF